MGDIYIGTPIGGLKGCCMCHRVKGPSRHAPEADLGCLRLISLLLVLAVALALGPPPRRTRHIAGKTVTSRRLRAGRRLRPLRPGAGAATLAASARPSTVVVANMPGAASIRATTNRQCCPKDAPRSAIVAQ